ncbi:PDR/VanB family oxidoreductase [Mycolicibacterium mengxianglii]|uniref:PDR/VanB family oxidoreductase n=1 Tax=Mycolicibacterium mengxianglii TaxID=2736649 RepID=UPI0018EEF692|nr:PDR/VanB family oxidoreductase [Mycolicibacterium mengxianglii]
MLEDFAIGRITPIGRDVKHFELIPVGSGVAPRPHAPGAHVVVETPVRVNSYSLTGDGVRPDSYAISVRRVGEHGGSAWLHDVATVGDRVGVSPPMSFFAPVPTARHHLLIAAGIGVTPILSHARAARRWGRSFTVIYGHAKDRSPHRDELAALTTAFTDVVGRAALTAAINGALRAQPVGTHLYACGPAPLLHAIIDRAAAHGWPRARLHVESFGTPDGGSGSAFTVHVANRGLLVNVPAGVSALHALDEVGLRVPRLCERGVCGQCRVHVTAGTPDHRDLILSAHERAVDNRFYPCVSRALTPELEVTIP